MMGLGPDVRGQIVKCGQVLDEVEGRANRICRMWDVRAEGEVSMMPWSLVLTTE